MQELMLHENGCHRARRYVRRRLLVFRFRKEGGRVDLCSISVETLSAKQFGAYAHVHIFDILCNRIALRDGARV